MEYLKYGWKRVLSPFMFGMILWQSKHTLNKVEETLKFGLV